MPKIEIREYDLTSAGGGSESFDVVYVPGLVNTELAELQRLNENGEYEYNGIEVNKPTLFTRVSDFVDLCGESPVTFADVQYYTDILTKDANGNVVPAFKDAAIPYDRIMFDAGDSDPGYVTAKELLNAGLPVLFERINGDVSYEGLKEKPEDWNTNYSRYFKAISVKTKIEGVKAPEFESGKYFKYVPATVLPEVEVTDKPEDWDTNFGNYYFKDAEGEYKSFELVAPAFEKDTYYNKVETTGEDESSETTYVLLTDKPEDWDTNFSNYYVKESDTEVYTQVAGDVPTFTTCYKLNVLEPEKWVELGEDDKPADWETRFFNYYEETSTIVPVTSVTDWKYTPAEGEGKPEVISVYKLNDGLNVASVYNALNAVYDTGDADGLADRGNYSVKYLTSGGYPTFEYDGNSLATKMTVLAETRGDCVALIDHTDNPYREKNINYSGNVYRDLCDAEFNSEYAAMFTPWASYNRTTTDYICERDENGSLKKEVNKTVDKFLRGSGSYAYLTSLADSIKTNANWLAIAGTARGSVVNLREGGMDTVITNGVADAMQPRKGLSMNAITEIKPYGNVIWGNRTLKKNGEGLTATSFLNIRNLVSDIKKTCYRTARKLTFEQNNDILWVNFKAGIAPTLDRMLSGYGISGYSFERDYDREEASLKATLCARIILYPVYPVEDFYIDIVLQDDEIVVE